MRSSYKKVSGMTAEIKIRRCYGCGATLQNLDRYESGYVSPKRAESDEGLCDRCYRLRHPGSNASQTITPAFQSMIRRAVESDALLCYVADAFSLDSSIVEDLAQLVKGGRVLALVNKVDLLPENITLDELTEGVRSRLSALGIEPLDIYLVSANREDTVKKLSETFEKYRSGKDVYLVGTQRVGKSAIINEFLKFYDNPTSRTITRENLGDSSDELVVTAIPLDGSSTLYDTPGVFEPTSMINQIDRRTLKYVLPRARITARNFSLRSGEGMAFGALAYCTLDEGKADLEAYFSSDVEILKIKSERADETFTDLCGGKGHPCSPTIRDADSLEKNEISLPDDGADHILSIVGFGRLRLAGHGQRFSIFVPKGVAVILHR